MNRALLKKSLLEMRLLLLACVAALFAFCWMRVYIVSRLELSSFASIVEKLWDKWKDFSPVPLSQLLSYAGRIAIAWDEPIVVFGMAIFAIARGSDAVSGELNRGTMEMLLAQPVSRLQVLYSQAVVTIGGILVIAFATWAGTFAGIYTMTVTEDKPPPSLHVPVIGLDIPLSFKAPEKVRVPMRDRVAAADMVPGAVNLFCLGVCWAGLATFASAWDRYRWRTIGVVAALFVLQMMMKIAGLAIDWLHWLLKATIFTAYEPQKFISIAINLPDQTWSLLLRDTQGQAVDLGPLGYNLILLAIGLVGYLAAGAVFHKRDLPAPM
jgi:ABC-2 type transport system permease protein